LPLAIAQHWIISGVRGQSHVPDRPPATNVMITLT
jgi:hypothetical protein